MALTAGRSIPHNSPQAARDQQPGMPQYPPQAPRDQQPGMPQHPPQWQGAPVPPPPQPNQDFNTRVPGDDAELNVNSIFRARGMQKPFVAGGQDILNTFKIDSEFIDLKQLSGAAADWKDWEKTSSLTTVTDPPGSGDVSSKPSKATRSR